jgi:alpha-beta hydrolase superfamily lysophospholipase
MGAMLAQAFGERHGDELVGLALSGTGGIGEGLAEMAAGMRGMVDAGMGDDPLPMLSTFNDAFEPARTPFDWLTRDEAEVDAYLADPLCGDDFPPTFGFLADLMELVAATMSPEGLDQVPSDLPILLLTGERDVASNMAENVHALEAALRERDLDVEAHYYPDARHEVFNETNRDEVTADLTTWIERVLA